MVVTEPRDSPESQMESNEACQEVQNALERLESDHRTILMLREFDELDYETIARNSASEEGDCSQSLSQGTVTFKKRTVGLRAVTQDRHTRARVSAAS